MSRPARRPILKKNVEAFVPSPRFLSDSPARHGSDGSPAHISYPGQPLPFHANRSPLSQHRKAPTPLAPANLYGGNTNAFNVDPGIPFLATAGPSEATFSNRGSFAESPQQEKGFVGGFVTGLKRAVTRKGSVREDANYRQAEEGAYPGPGDLRDSGYAPSTRLEAPQTPFQPPRLVHEDPEASLSSRTSQSTVAASETLIGDHQGKLDDKEEKPADASQAILSPESMASPVSAELVYSANYVKMNSAPASDSVSFNTYVSRMQKFIHDLATLPWIAKDRVTVDYYPAKAQRAQEPHRPVIAWHSQNYSRDNNAFDPAFSDRESAASDTSSPYPDYQAPARTSYGEINLNAEFTNDHSSFPQQPPNFSQTPGRPMTGDLTPGPMRDTQQQQQTFVSPVGGPLAHDYGLWEDVPGPPVAYVVNPWGTPAESQYVTQAIGYPPTSAAFAAPHVPPTQGPSRPRSRSQQQPPQPLPTSTQPPNQSQHRRHRSGRTRARRASADEWEQYPRFQNGYVPYSQAEHSYGLRYGPARHAPGGTPVVAVVSGPPSTASIKQPQPIYPAHVPPRA
ncbi:hypothetical protein B0H34DRAFT_802932 [Crassisporium funariophilum]|nr:hypothetical protein B0H34DRAFT_802932 [Crassisporium funariophilum]